MPTRFADSAKGRLKDQHVRRVCAGRYRQSFAVEDASHMLCEPPPPELLWVAVRFGDLVPDDFFEPDKKVQNARQSVKDGSRV